MSSSRTGTKAQEAYQAGWETGVKYVFERLQSDPIQRVHHDCEVILQTFHAGKVSKRSLGKAGRRLLPSLMDRTKREA